MPDRLIKLKECATMAGISTITVQRWERDGKFPKRVKFPGKTPRWLESDVLAWMQSLKDAEQLEARTA